MSNSSPWPKRPDASGVLSESDEKYRTLFEHSEDGMWLIKDDYFINANPAAARMLRYEDVEELSNTHPSELSPEFQPDGEPSFQKAGEMMALAKKYGRHRFEWDHKKKDGEVFPVDVTLTRVPIEGQDLLLCTWRDITEQKEAEDALRQARDVAQATTNVKAEFLSNMSHEIRTPMAGILGMLRLISPEELSEKNQTYIKNALVSAEALLDLINDILDLSRLEAGRMTVSHGSVQIQNLVQQVLCLLGNNADKKNLTLRATFDENVPETIVVDGNHLRQILLNLIGNALKFTDEGEVVVSISMREQEPHEPAICVTVSDTGIGIPEEALDVIFSRFKQVDGSTTRSYAGSGLGLSICRELIALHGGEIRAESQVGQGSQFSFYMSCGQSENKSAGQPPASHNCISTREFSEAHILIAEDNKVNQLVISGLLEQLDISHEIFDDGKQLLNRLTNPPNGSLKPSLLLMDVQMPVMDGIVTTRFIRSSDNPEIAQIPIVATTANAMVGQKEEYLSAGMTGYLSKPIKTDDLRQEILKMLEQEH